VNITLYALREVVVDNLHDPLEIHTRAITSVLIMTQLSPPPHPSDRIFSFSFRHTRMKAIYIWNAIDYQLLGQG